MRKTIALALIWLAPTAWAQQDEGKKSVERPLKKALAPAADKVDLARTGIEWNEGLGAALNKQKPILLFQLLGRFDDRFC